MTDADLPPDFATTTDAFHRGRFHLVQPAKSAHRAGIDAMLLAACVADKGPMRIADFGAGAGAAGLAVLSRCDGAQVTLLENNSMMIECARRTLALPENAAYAARASIEHQNIEALALPPDQFDWVIMNPPFNDPADRTTPHATKADAHVMQVDLFEIWLKRAASVLHAKGQVALIARPESLPEIVSACARRFGALRVTPVQPRAHEDAIRILLTGQKGNRKRMAIGKPVILQAAANSHAFTDEADALINGLRAL